MTAPFEPRRVLLPTDFSEPASAALPYAAQLAHDFGAELHLLHAIVLHDYAGIEPGRRFPEYQEIIDSLNEEVGSLLSSLAETAEAGGITVRRAERRGVAAAPVILEYAKEQDIDLIVMATHGHRGVRKMFMGSVAEEVVRHASVPVLTVRGRDRFVGEGDRASILVAADLTSLTATLVEHAARLSAWTGAEVCLFHGVELPRAPMVYESYPELPMISYEDIEQEARTALTRLLAESSLDPERSVIEVVREAPASAIVRRCEEDPLDLVIVGHRHRSGLDRMFLGSVADRVVNRCPCPVLTVPVADGESPA